jgi:hypothetical protein
MRWRDVHLLASSRSGSSVQERLLRTQAQIVAIEAALKEGKPERRWDVDPDGFPLEPPVPARPELQTQDA